MKKTVLTILSIMVIICSFAVSSQAFTYTIASPNIRSSFINTSLLATATYIGNVEPDFRVKNVEVCNNLAPQTTEVRVTVENIGGNKGLPGNLANYIMAHTYTGFFNSAAPYHGDLVPITAKYNNQFGTPTYVQIGINQAQYPVVEKYTQNNVSMFLPPCNWTGCLEDPFVSAYYGCKTWVQVQ